METNEQFLERESLDGEIWKDVVNCSGYYMVSNKGRVFGCGRNIKSHKGTIKYKKPLILVAKIGQNGYCSICLNIDGTKKTVLVHRLVAEAFIPNPANKPFVDHIDGNRSNNILENLRWVDGQENANNPNTVCWFRGTHRKCPFIFNTPVIGVSLDGKEKIEFESISVAAKAGYVPSAISNCCRGLNNYHHSMRWYFKEDYELNNVFNN